MTLHLDSRRSDVGQASACAELQLRLRKSVLTIVAALSTVAFAADTCTQAMEAHRSGNTAAALPLYEECLKGQPTQATEMRSNYGAALAHEGRYQDAITQYRLAIDAAPDRPQLRFNLALAYYKQGNIGGAAEQLKSLPQGNMQVTLLLADCHLRLGELKQVIDLLGPLEAAHNNDAGFAYLLGTALIRSGDVARGEAVVDRILKDANSPEAHFLLASAAFANQNYPDAAKEFSKAVELNPNLPEAWSFYGQTLLFSGDADGAADAFRRELAINPNDFESNIKLGSILAARANYREALTFLGRAQMLRPDSPEAKAELDAAKAGKPIATQSSDSGLLKPGTKAPPFTFTTGSTKVTQEGPAVIVFGSYTCPQFRFGSPAVNQLYERYQKQIRFEMIYIQEAHTNADWQSTINTRSGVEQPTARNITEKIAYAAACARKLTIPYPLAVDSMDRAVENAYHAWPSATYVIGRDGRIAWSSRMGEFEFKPAALEQAIQQVLKR